MSLLKEATEAARACSDTRKRKALQERTDELRDAFGRFTISCNREDMAYLVAAWSRVILALNSLPPLPEHGPNGGRMAAPKEALTNAA